MSVKELAFGDQTEIIFGNGTGKDKTIWPSITNNMNTIWEGGLYISIIIRDGG